MNNKTTQFDNQVVVITGGSTGIGLATAEAFLNSGTRRVYVTGRHRDTLDQAVDKLGEKAVAVVSDVSSRADLQDLAATIEENGDVIDVIFANAGIAEKNQLGDSKESSFDKIFGINVKGVFFTIQTLVPLMKDQGAIVLNASIVANKGMAELSFYNASKAAVRSFARSFANDLRGRKIRVNAISPGFTHTPIMKNGLRWNQEQIAALDTFASEAVPAGYVATPDEIAGAVMFLASKDASYVNGVELVVDGGFSQI